MSCAHSANLLRQVAVDLRGWPLEQQAQSLALQLNNGAQVSICARRQKLFMAAIYHSEFSLSGTLDVAGGKISARQRGWVRHLPVEFVAANGELASLAAHLNQYAALRETLGELDYHRFSLTIENGLWRCAIEPWAASEVACRLPPLRRYLRLPQQQRVLLLSVLQMMGEALTRYCGKSENNSA